MRRAFLTILFASFLGAASPVWGHPGDDGHIHEKPANLRVWKDADGLFELEAAFIAAKDEKVLLARIDGSQISIPLSRLSRGDQDWVAQRMEEIRVLNTLHSGRVQNVLDANPSEKNPPGAGLAAIGVLIGLAGIGFVVRRRRLGFALVAMFLGLSCTMLACSARPETGKEFVAWNDGPQPAIVAHFNAFKDTLKFRWNDDTLFIDSNGLPDHPMMVGITNWQQQVPLPQPYFGKNAWQIPLRPRMAEKPISTKKALYRGAIALAVNGVPIFNALNNRGEDAFLIGELDEFGGHCGKGDDYHYHVAPLHLQKLVGEGNPIGYALDGFPLLGLTTEKLDEFNGRFDDKGNYSYHSTKTYPYINGGLRGVVEVRNDGIEPQPQTANLRPPGQPLRGAKITGFTVNADKTDFSLKYEVKGQFRKIDYKLNADGTVAFTFVDEQDKQQTEIYTRREPKGGDKKDDKKGDEKKKKG